MKIRELEDYSIDIHNGVQDQLKRFVYNRSDEAFAAGDKARDDVQNIDQLEARRTYMRERLIEAIGGLPINDTPLNARITGTLEFAGYKIEKIIYESSPGIFVTSNLYIPNGITSSTGAVLFLCGHHNQAKQTEEYQVVCQYLVRAGLVVLAMDPVGQGERLSYYEHSSNETTVNGGVWEHEYAGNQCWQLGDGIARYFIHDAMRSIDYLCTRPEVNPAKIGVTGNSGGGTQTSLMMICDSRIAAAAPATFIMNRQTYMYANQGQDSEQIWPGMTALGFDHEDILLAMAPRPVLVLAALYDYFPIEGTRRTVKRTKRFWEMYAKEDCICLFEDNTIHKYSPSMANKSAEFFSKHLLGKQVSLSTEAIKPVTPSLLWCTNSGQVRGEFEASRFVYDANYERLAELEQMHESFTEIERKEKALLWLRKKVFSSRRRCDLNPRFTPMENLNEMMVENSIWWSQEGIFNHAFIFRNHQFLKTALPLTIAIWDGGTTELQAHADWLRDTCSAGRSVMVLNVSGTGPLTPHAFKKNNDPLDFYEVIHKLTTDLMWLDDSLAAMRTYDVLRAIDMVEHINYIRQDDIRIYAYGRQSVYAQFASVLTKRVEYIQVINNIKSMSDWIKARHYNNYDILSLVLPGMLRYFDIPDLVRWNSKIEGE